MLPAADQRGGLGERREELGEQNPTWARRHLLSAVGNLGLFRDATPAGDPMHRKIHALLVGAWASQEVIAVRPEGKNEGRMDDVAGEAANAFGNAVQMGRFLTGQPTEVEEGAGAAKVAAAATEDPAFTWESRDPFVNDTGLMRPEGELETEVGTRRRHASSAIR